jgi:glycerol kinase
MQLQADILGCDVLRSAAEELSALGAAWLGGVQLGWWTSVAEPYAAGQAPQQFAAQWDAATRASLRARWKSAVRKTLTKEMA